MEDMIRPSPRKEIYRDRSKTMVGVTSGSEYDDTTFELPFRTSTPIRGRGRSTPPLPPYSESDISISPSPRNDAEGLSTPRAAFHGLVLDDHGEGEHPFMREMERQADQFFETGLRGRCWDVWTAASDWVQVSDWRSTDRKSV